MRDSGTHSPPPKSKIMGGVPCVNKDGNAYYLLSVAKQFGLQMGMDAELVISEMRSGDYDNLVQTFDKYFGGFVILEVA